MKAKDKNRKIAKFTLKNTVFFSAVILIGICSFLFYEMHFQRITYAKEVNIEPKEDIKISNAQKIDIENILNKNSQEDRREEYLVQETELEYITKYKTNKNLPKGMIQVVQEGRQGKQEVTIKKVYEKDKLISEEQVGTRVTKSSINKIVEIGGGRAKSNYKVKIGDIVYVTSDRLSVMAEPNEQAQKVATLAKNDELKITEIQGDWYKIICGTIRGFVKNEATTYINPNSKYEEEVEAKQPQNRAKLNSKLSFDMALNKPSGLSLEQFKKVLRDAKDTNKVFEDNAEYFYYIEKQYNINGIFVAAIGIHESAWGTSKISKDKNNLFGYGAYDSNPYNGAYSFTEYSESIDLIARVLVKYYLNPKGTSIYGGEKAAGTYYNGSTLSGVNTKYATDKNWANGVYSHMKYLYNKL